MRPQNVSTEIVRAACRGDSKNSQMQDPEYTDSLYADRILPYSPWSIIDIRDDRALEEVIRRSRIEDERRRHPRFPHQPHYDVPFIPPQRRVPEPPQPRIYIDE